MNIFGKIKQAFSSDDAVWGLFKSTDRQGASFAWSKGQAMSLYEKSLYTNKAIQKRAEKIGQIEFVIKDRKGNVVENEWDTLLDKPNSQMTGNQFWATAQSHYDIFGAAFILKDYGDQVFTSGKIPSQLSLLNPASVELVYNTEKTEVVAFRYARPDGGYIEYQANQVIYYYRPSPRDPLVGESLLSAAVRAIETEVDITSYQSNVLKNGGRLETIFKAKAMLTKENLDKLKQQYREQYAGAKAAGEPLFLGGDMDIQNTALSPVELAYLDTKVSTREDIATATGVPVELLSVTSGATYANADASIRIFLRETIKPVCENLVNVLDWRLFPDDLSLSFVDRTPEDTEAKMLVLKTASEVGALTTNEKREQIGLDPIANGDSILVPMNMVELNSPAPDQQVKKKALKHPLSDPEIRKAYAKLADKRLTRQQNKMLPITQKFFEDQETRILEQLGESKKRKNLIDDIFNVSREIAIAKDTFIPVIRDIFKESGQDTMNTFELGRFDYTTDMESAIQRRGELLSDSIIATTNDQLQKVFAESVANAEPRQKLVERIKNLYNTISKGRAEVIARTEVHNAVQEANLFAYKQGGLFLKIWVTVGDGKVRESHQVLDGEERPINMPFSNGLMYPSEPNCRCSI